MTLPPDHPRRIELNDEVHARPPERLIAPARISYLALVRIGDDLSRHEAAVADLCRRHGVATPPANTIHFSADLGPFRLKWERHTEFVRYTFIIDGPQDDPFDPPAIATVPADWLASLPGQVIVAAHAAFIPASQVALIPSGSDAIDGQEIGRRWFEGNMPLGAAVSGGAAIALTDFRIHSDGFSRHLLLDWFTTPWQAGRILARLLEIDTYRVMALLGLPLARASLPLLAASGQELADITAALVNAASADEPALLDRLTRLEASIENRHSETRYRFSASEAYHDLVRLRIDDLREQRIQGLQTFREFTERRLTPAMATCRSVAARQETQSQRVARATRLLATRVDLTREKQNQALLESMNRRASLQLRLQSTVEGLSVAAVTYYVTGLIGHAAEAAHEAGAPVSPVLILGVSIPIVAAIAAYGMHRIRHAVSRPGDMDGGLAD